MKLTSKLAQTVFALIEKNFQISFWQKGECVFLRSEIWERAGGDITHFDILTAQPSNVFRWFEGHAYFELIDHQKSDSLNPALFVMVPPELARQSRRFCFHKVRRGKSGLHRVECQVTPGGREPTESAAESEPPTLSG